MKTLTLNVPDTLDPTEARWEMARALYEKGSLTLEQAASVAELAPTYFKRRLEDIKSGHFSATNAQFERGNHLFNKPFDQNRFNALTNQMNIQEPLDELLAMLTK
ncbi:hypothetical protein GCM10028808_37240 [Spirosoma migulaei]